jgi:hypothetical protein
MVEVLRRLGVGRRFARRSGNCPSVRSVEALLPPSIDLAELRNSVQCGFHAARSRSFHWNDWKVEPEIHALHQQMPDVHVVVLEKRDASLELRISREMMYALKDFLAGFVFGVRLAGEYDLNRARGVHEDVSKPLDILEYEIRSLVCSESSCESDCECIGIEEQSCANELRRLV